MTYTQLSRRSPATIQGYHEKSLLYIEDTPELELSRAEFQLVGQGKFDFLQRRLGKTAIGSDGFGHCSALLLSNDNNSSLAFAHVQPFDRQLYLEINAVASLFTHSVIISGSVSTPQLELTDILTASKIEPTRLRIHTGDTHYSVILDARHNRISVLKKSPTYEIVTFEASDVFQT